jgi:hypothetical protein
MMRRLLACDARAPGPQRLVSRAQSCDDLLEEHHDLLVDHYHRDVANVAHVICVDRAAACTAKEWHRKPRLEYLPPPPPPPPPADPKPATTEGDSATATAGGEGVASAAAAAEASTQAATAEAKTEL